MLDKANQLQADSRGFIEQNSASIITQTIINDYQSVTRTVAI